MADSKQGELKQISLLKQNTVEMLELAQTMFAACFDGFFANDVDILKQVPADEVKITKIYHSLTESAIKISQEDLSAEARSRVEDLVDIICSIERIADCCVGLVERIEYKIIERLMFSETAVEEYQDLHSKINQLLLGTIKAMKTNNPMLAKNVKKSKSKLDTLVDKYRASHIKRSAKGICDDRAKVRYLDMLDFTKEAAYHCIEVAGKLKG